MIANSFASFFLPLLFSFSALAYPEDYASLSQRDLSLHFENASTSSLDGRLYHLMGTLTPCAATDKEVQEKESLKPVPSWTSFFQSYKFSARNAGLNFRNLKETCGLDFEEFLALSIYTDYGYSRINSELREGSYITDSSEKAIYYLKKGLKKVSVYTGLVFRAASKPELNRILMGIKENPIYTLKNFMSTSTPGFTKHYFSRNTQVQIQAFTKTCGYIRDYSSYPEELEVLCPPGTKFKVLWYDSEKTPARILLDEVSEPAIEKKPPSEPEIYPSP